MCSCGCSCWWGGIACAAGDIEPTLSTASVDALLAQWYVDSDPQRRTIARTSAERHMYDLATGNASPSASTPQQALRWGSLEREHGALTYGEFDVAFFAATLRRAEEYVLSHVRGLSTSDVVFCDLGSGCGRLVLSAALLRPNWKRYEGIELLSDLHQRARDAHNLSIRMGSSFSPSPRGVTGDGDGGVRERNRGALSACRFTNTDMCSDEARRVLSDCHVVFCYSTALPVSTACAYSLWRKHTHSS